MNETKSEPDSHPPADPDHRFRLPRPNPPSETVRARPLERFTRLWLPAIALVWSLVLLAWWRSRRTNTRATPPDPPPPPPAPDPWTRARGRLRDALLARPAPPGAPSASAAPLLEDLAARLDDPDLKRVVDRFLEADERRRYGPPPTTPPKINEADAEAEADARLAELLSVLDRIESEPKSEGFDPR